MGHAWDTQRARRAPHTQAAGRMPGLPRAGGKYYKKLKRAGREAKNFPPCCLVCAESPKFAHAETEKNAYKMKARTLLLQILLLASLGAQAQKHEFANWNRYAQANQTLGLPAKGERRVVLMGNSITDGWPGTHPQFFKDNGLIGRGISGQTSYQFLLRFRQDVINLRPKVVVINYGTNDIAENTGAYDEDLTFGNVCSMVELARYHKIKVILTSCLPAGGFGWRRGITDSMQKIRSLNERVRAYARANKIPYVDYFSAMVNDEGTAMRAEYAKDNPGVHPNAEGYTVMERLLLPVIKKLR